jgi:hypothetical protein
MTGELLTDALRWIRELPRFADLAKTPLVMEQAPCHMTVNVAMAVALLGMDLIPVPQDSTGRCQPMDVRVFGVLKRKQSKLYDDAMRACPGRAWTRVGAVRTTVEARRK